MSEILQAFKKAGANYTVPAAAEALGVPYAVLRKAILAKEVRTIVVGRRVIVPDAEVTRLAELLSKGDAA